MTQIDIDGEGARDGLMTLVVTVIELLVEVMEREAIRRMESGDLTDEEVERIGSQFAALEDELESIKDDEGIDQPVEELRGQLDGVVEDAIRSIDESRHQDLTYNPIEDD